MRQKFLIFLKGILMGICDLIPGISGGTIAFITGIYSRLINSVKGFSPKLLFDLIKYPFISGVESRRALKRDIKKLDLGFLITLLLGIGTAILIGSNGIKYLLENYVAYTLAFFVGLILASSKIIFNNIKNHKIKNILFGVLGLIIGIMLAFMIPAEITPSLGYVFVGGFVAISAMFLPGISGAFILLIMGLYEFMINVLHNISNNLNYFMIFVVGIILGAFTISRVISFLFKKDKCKTLYVLLGLVVGALSVPLIKINEEISKGGSLFFSIMFVVLGIILVFGADKYGRAHRQKIIASE